MKKIFICLAITFAILIIMPIISASTNNIKDNKDKLNYEDDIILSILDTTSKEVFETSLNDYLWGVVAAEMPASYEIDALKAQAIASRSYILRRKENRSKDHNNADVCNDYAHCLAHISKDEAKAKWGDDWFSKYENKITQAINSTKNVIITYEDEIANAVFFAISSGKTENAKDIWGSEVPYLVASNSEFDVNAKGYSSEFKISEEEFFKSLKKIQPKFVAPEKPQLSIGKITKTLSGTVTKIMIGKTEFTGAELRKEFLLRSSNFTLQYIEGEFIFKVVGYGHNVGMSQAGANELAKKGKNFEEILQNYYKGVTLCIVKENE